MAGLDELIDFIESAPSGEWGWKWKPNLTKSIPEWRNIIAEAYKDPLEWKRIEHIRLQTEGRYAASNNYLVHRILVDIIGLELARKWFYSDVDNQKSAAISWSADNLSMWSEFDQDLKEAIVDEHDFVHKCEETTNAFIWDDLNKAMKSKVLTRLFDWYPGEPFESIKHLRHESEMENRRRVRIPFAPPSYLVSHSYVPAPKIDHIRNIIQEAGDVEYLVKIDEMISRREKACQSMAQILQRVPCNPKKNERELIARLMEITGRNGYLPAALPPILLSSETPPIFVVYPELEEDEDNEEHELPRNRDRRLPETVSIEELLGVYQPQHEQIIIYERGIRWRRHRLDEEWLFAVVLIHEIGHWITHMLPKPGIPTWATDLYVLGERDVHEGWAQLMTWWIADQVGGEFKQTFEKLNRNQSPSYRVFEQFKDQPIDKMMASLEKLRGLSDPVRLKDWKKAIDLSTP